ncbi:sulfotransferase domain-containing protein [Roseovarius aestuariivivens]|uniref:sulfotransferase domain-containing protein n=1 Tax=Roseovarius aestuariivivens TaxID=1888910 RepID=UPI0010820C7E|nr:sulfotransferase domain-containing protein [Roseovarius aestuariivivens]
MKNSIVWLASYPKSGNTWLRIFLANYLANSPKPLGINQVQLFGFGDSKPQRYQQVAGGRVDTSNPHATLQLRARVLQAIVANNADVNFVKTHNIRGDAMQVELIPAKFTRSAIYVIRNPLDLVLSYARHYGLTPEKTVEAIGRSDNANAPDASTTWQFLGTWSEHVKSWTHGTRFPVLPLRYEDMLDTPHESFSEALEFLGITPDPDRLDRAIRFSSFDELSKQEEKSGFTERSPHSERFFASGKSGGWKKDLSRDLIDKVRRDHKRMMKKYGYYNV